MVPKGRGNYEGDSVPVYGMKEGMQKRKKILNIRGRYALDQTQFGCIFFFQLFSLKICINMYLKDNYR